MAETRYWVGFNIVQQIGPARVQALRSRFGDLQAAWHAPERELRAAGLNRPALENLLSARSQLDLDAEMQRIQKAGVTVLTLESAEYPPRLLQIQHPPPVLYVKGTILPQDEWAVAVVGTRRATTYGQELTRRLAGDLARNGVTVVSGLARGIDSYAHRAALDAGGRTIAVLGSGVDIIYPPENARLAGDIQDHGALVTEYCMGTKPEGRNFPPRNRIISGMSLGTLVTEAGKGSGALITADYALEQGREAFAVPGSAFKASCVGTNGLIQRGEAKLVTDVKSILEELNLCTISEQLEAQEIIPSDATESDLLRHISVEPIHIDELGRVTGLPITDVSSALTLMELKGLVRQVGGMTYVLAREAPVRYVID